MECFKYNVWFDRSAPPVFVGQRSFSAAIPACSMYSRDAVWALVLPCVSHSVRCHALRLLLAQRLFLETDAFSGYYQLHATSSVGPFPESEAGQAVDAQALVLFLDAWKCASNLTFFGCIDALVEDMFKNGSFINQHEKSLLKSWIIALQKTAGVVEPARRSSPWRGVRKVSEVRMTFGSVLSQLESGGSKVEQRLRSQCADQVKRSCNGSVGGVNWFPAAQWRKPLIMEVVLIVVFNSNRFFWNNLPFLETMHRPFFKWCGSGSCSPGRTGRQFVPLLCQLRSARRHCTEPIICFYCRGNPSGLSAYLETIY